MTLLIGFHQQRYRTFKYYYTEYLCVYWRSAFLGLVSYQRFVTWMSYVLLLLCAYFKFCFGRYTGIGLIDLTSLKVCYNRRIHQH